eukprot:6212538-Pleurochrysis_carterae.AAC.1
MCTDHAHVVQITSALADSTHLVVHVFANLDRGPGQSQESLRKARNKAEALACVRSLFKAKLKSCRYLRHVSLYSTVEFMRGELSQSEREVGGSHEEKPNLRKVKAGANAWLVDSTRSGDSNRSAEERWADPLACMRRGDRD